MRYYMCMDGGSWKEVEVPAIREPYKFVAVEFIAAKKAQLQMMCDWLREMRLQVTVENLRSITWQRIDLPDEEEENKELKT